MSDALNKLLIDFFRTRGVLGIALGVIDRVLQARAISEMNIDLNSPMGSQLGVFAFWIVQRLHFPANRQYVCTAYGFFGEVICEQVSRQQRRCNVVRYKEHPPARATVESKLAGEDILV